MKTSLVALCVLFMWPRPAVGQKLQGRLAVGDEVLAVSGEIMTERTGALRISLDLSRSGKGSEHSLIATVTSAGGQATVDGYSFPVSGRLAAGWQTQLRDGLAGHLSPDQFDCRQEPEGGRTCDSKSVIMLGPGLPGRVRFSYNRGRLTGIRFFSLAEWNNRFGAYVSLSLDIR